MYMNFEVKHWLYVRLLVCLCDCLLVCVLFNAALYQLLQHAEVAGDYILIRLGRLHVKRIYVENTEFSCSIHLGIQYIATTLTVLQSCVPETNDRGSNPR